MQMVGEIDLINIWVESDCQILIKAICENSMEES